MISFRILRIWGLMILLVMLSKASAEPPYFSSFSRVRYFRPALYFQDPWFDAFGYRSSFYGPGWRGSWSDQYRPYQPSFSPSNYYLRQIQSGSGLEASRMLYRN